MALVNLKSILKPAFAQGYAVGAFNAVDLAYMEAITQTAVAQKSPVIVNVAEVHLQYLDWHALIPAILATAARVPVPVVLNLDHGLSFDVIVEALKLGFTSIMFDGSKLDYEENVRQTAEIVRMCHAVDVSVEAELGAVGGDEGGGIAAEANPALFTDPDLAVDFVQRTGIDALAVAIGNAHGKYRGKPKLDFELLTMIRKMTPIPLVLHGGSGISDADFQHAVKLGIAKINIFTEMAQAALKQAAADLQTEGERYNNYPELMVNIRNAVSGVVSKRMDVFGSTNKAGQRIGKGR